MKLLYLNPTGALGGAERAMLDGAAMVRAHNPDWQLELIASSDGGLIEEARALRIASSVLRFPPSLAALGETHAVPDGRRWLPRLKQLGAAIPAITEYSRKLAELLDRSAPDLIHANGFKMHVLGARSLPKRCAMVWHLHDYVRSRPLMRRLLQIYATRCNTIIAVSQSIADDIASVLKGNIPIYTVYNAVALDHFSPRGERADLDALSGLPAACSGVVRVGLAATAARWKGHEIFLRALASLPRNLPVRGYVIGGPIDETEGSQFTMSELRVMAAHFGVAERVGFTGHLDEVAPAMRALDIVVHASIAPEPFGLVIAEAMASGRAVISSALGGAAELVEDERNAVVYPSGEPDALACAIQRLASDRELRTRLGEVGRATAEKRFDRERLGSQLTAIYKTALAASSRGDDANPARA